MTLPMMVGLFAILTEEERDTASVSVYGEWVSKARVCRQGEEEAIHTFSARGGDAGEARRNALGRAIRYVSHSHRCSERPKKRRRPVEPQ